MYTALLSTLVLHRVRRLAYKIKHIYILYTPVSDRLCHTRISRCSRRKEGGTKDEEKLPGANPTRKTLLKRTVAPRDLRENVNTVLEGHLTCPRVEFLKTGDDTLKATANNQLRRAQQSTRPETTVSNY